MKNTILILVMLIASNFTHGQSNYDKISEFGKYHGDWALVESNELLGFIDREGNEVVKPKYDKFQNEGKLQGETEGKIEIIKN